MDILKNDTAGIDNLDNKSVKGKTEKRITIITWVLIFLSWYILTRLEIFSATLLPSPYRVWNAFIRVLKEGYNGISLLA
ncbi:MAG TPA: ABC transporter permease, partial [Halanaerobiales bacterium]|nr:ABC transporter permease [Halanaerobiales bacterium]